MKQLFIFSLCALSIFLSPFIVKAQEYQVFSINGNAERFVGKEWKPLVKAQPLKGSDKVRTSKKGSLTILDNSRRKVYAVQCENGGRVDVLTATQRARAKSLSKEAFAEVAKNMFGKQDERYATRGGVTYRGENSDETLASWLKANVNSEFTISNSSFSLTLHVMNPTTHQAVHTVHVGESVELEVVNESDEMLYAGVVDIDAEGVWSAVSTNCELIPPHSTVLLPYPVEFFEPLGTDHLLLVAYTEAFNLQRVIELMPGTDETPDGINAGAAVVGIKIQ